MKPLSNHNEDPSPNLEYYPKLGKEILDVIASFTFATAYEEFQNHTTYFQKSNYDKILNGDCYSEKQSGMNGMLEW